MNGQPAGWPFRIGGVPGPAYDERDGRDLRSGL